MPDIDTMSTATTLDDPKEGQYLENPFLHSGLTDESVAMNSGALVYTHTDFVLPGKNGFDLKIARRYNSSNSNTEVIDSQELSNGKYKTIGKDNSHEPRAF